MSGGSAFRRLFRGETSFDFAGRWRRWFAVSGLIILVGLVSLGFRGLNFSIDFKGGTVWEVPSNASVASVRSAVSGVSGSLSQASIQVLTDAQTGKRTVKVQAAAKETANAAEVNQVTDVLARLAHVSANEVQLNDVGPSWGSDITDKAIEGVIVFLVVVSGYIWLRFEAKMAIAALTALVHDIAVTVGIYSLSGFTVSPDTVIAFLTILGYSLYDTIVVFDKVQENTRGLASSNKLTYTDTVNLSMNQVLARSINTSFVAIIPIMSILVIGAWILGASALEDFGLALFIGLTTGAYSSIFIASPLLALLKEREHRYAAIRRRLADRPGGRLTPAGVAAGALGGERPGSRPAAVAAAGSARAAAPTSGRATGPDAAGDTADATEGGATVATGGAAVGGASPARSGPPPRPRKKTRRR
ncbi:MAG TPA: protein translocase subunit SecF [Acidimicrobiales bacterium]|nr:protein translocase subunit SecF [Acidimicrobiales bacterium]